ncbi:MAG TPA: tryptophan RNA-binding attenuation protein, partial [Clostridium sp.]|nr:tryptophan RNA-binding attenuation protein [Clostridium sp.]
WTGRNPSIGTQVGWKTLIGQTSGESYYLQFNEPGQKVIIQPSERLSGLKLSID